MTVSEANAAKKKHRKALQEYYASKGVGRSVKQRLAYWESQHPDGYSISHNPNDKQKVWVFESVWCIENFPRDFVLC